MKEKEYKCDTCDAKFSTQGSVTKHVRNIHGQKAEHVCKICHKTYGLDYNLKRHMRQAHGDGGGMTVKCDICDTILSRKDSLPKHIELCHSDSDKQFQCQLCDKKYVDMNGLQLHVNATHQEPY